MKILIKELIMNKVKTSTVKVLLAIFALGFLTSNIAKAESNPFAANDLVTIASKDNDNKCGEGKCGEGKTKAAKKSKCGEGKCGEGKMKAAKKGKCGEGKCGEGKMKAAKKGKCGEGKCGEGKMKDKSKKCGG